MRELRYGLWSVSLLAVLSVGCAGGGPVKEATAEEKAPAHSEHYLEIGGIPKPWSVSVRPLGTGQGSELAVTSHKANVLEVWRVGPERSPRKVASSGEVGFHPDEVRWLDWDGDGEDRELLVAAEGAGQVQLWRWDGDTLLRTDAVRIRQAPRDAFAADLDGDGRRDIVSGPYKAGDVTVLWGKGGFEFEVEELAGNETPAHPRPIDWDGDGRTDIAWSEWDTGPVKVAFNRGDRRFEVVTLDDLAGKAPRQLTVGDVDGDGRDDLVVAMELGKAARVLYNRGNDGEVEKADIPAPVWGYSAAVVGVAPDGGRLLALSEEERIILARRSGGGWSQRQVPAGSLPLALQFADVDGDGVQDLAFANSAGESIGIVFGPLWEHAQEVER